MSSSRLSGWTLSILVCLQLVASSDLPHPGTLNNSTELSIANSLAEQWGLTSWRQFLQVAGEKGTVGSVLQSGSHSSLVVAVLGDRNSKPMRRNVSSKQPFLDLSEVGADHARLLGLDVLNRGASAMESALGRRLYPFRLRPMDMQLSGGKAGCFAVWNVSSGELHIDNRVFTSFAASLQPFSGFLPSFAAALPQQLSRFIRTQNSTLSTDTMVTKLAAKVIPVSIALAVASVGPPVWFCIACPVILGLLAPFLFNFGLGSAASMICQHYNLPSQECNDLVRSVVLHPTSMFVGVSSLQGSFHDIMNEQGTSNGVTLSSTGTAPQNRAGDLVSLGSGFLRVTLLQWYGAFALAMVLSLASAVPIVYICQLPRCGRRT